ncbi:MAG: TrmB family transcriptional regulator [Firmicutes bacterium]|nr:TrmB family transcriptional regulator [Bacillota bacterium]
MDDPLAHLQALGFSPYEAKAYLALLKKHPVTGYELSRLSGVPSAKIYETIDRLKAREAVTVVLGDPLRYAPIPPGELLRGLRRHFETAVTGLEESLSRMARTEPEYVWNIRHYDLLMEKAAELIATAHRELASFLWASEAKGLLAAFAQAAERGVRIFGVLCGTMEGLPQLLRHGFEDAVLEEQQGRLLVIVRDEEEAVLGGIETETMAVVTRNFGVVRVALEYVKHELYQAKIMKRYGCRFVEDFVPHLERLRPGGGEE